MLKCIKHILIGIAFTFGTNASTYGQENPLRINTTETSNKEVETNGHFNGKLMNYYKTIADNLNEKDLERLFSKQILKKASADLNNQQDNKHKCFERLFPITDSTDVFDSLAASQGLILTTQNSTEKGFSRFVSGYGLFDFFSKNPELRFLSLDHSINLFSKFSTVFFGFQVLNKTDSHAGSHQLSVLLVRRMIDVIERMKECVDYSGNKSKIEIGKLKEHILVFEKLGDVLFRSINTESIINALMISRALKYYNSFNMIVKGFKILRFLFR